MSFSESRSSFIHGSDAISIFPQPAIENDNQSPDFDLNPPQFKRPRNSVESQSNSSNNNNSNGNINNSNNIFFKTRLCAKFKLGTCRNGENCNFAHGIEDIRQPPPNWQEMVGLRGGGNEEDARRSPGNWDDDQKIIHRMKLCKKFYNGEECPYGDRCNFLHEDPSKFRDDTGRFRESSAISIGTCAPATATVVVGGVLSSGNGGEENRAGLNNVGSDLMRTGSMKPFYWKTKLCNKWDQTGHCPFGEKCHFAHGFPELQVFSGRAEFDSLGITSFSTKPQSSSNDLLSPGTTNVGAFDEELQAKKFLLKWKGLKKINRIYGDWLDDLPLVNNIPSRVES